MKPGDRTVRLVLAVAAVALVARFVLLGSRVAHFDEARVAWWGLDYLETGETGYRYIIHGPLMQHLHRPLFATVGASDFAMRAPVAAVGGLSPLVALWFRRRLDDVEVLALAAFLAFDPILLYYSRFARSTVFVAAFCFVSFAALVRWYDGDGIGYLYVAAAFLALGFGAKENAVVYVLCWLGAATLLVVGARVRIAPPVDARTRLRPAVRGFLNAYTPDGADRRPVRLGLHLLGAVAVGFVVVAFLYAPRGGDAGLWSGSVGATAGAAWGNIVEGMEYWFGRGGEKDLAAYRRLLERFLGTSLEYAGALVALSVVGFLSELSRRGEARKLVLGCGYWGFASVVGYPLGTDIWGAWIIVNALVPLSVPAAVGLRVLVDIGRESLSEADRVSAGIVGVLLLFVVGQVVVVGASTAFVQPASPDNDLVQFSQPQPEIREPADRTAAIAAAHEGDPDVLFYGSDDFVDGSGFRSPECIRWIRTLPWAWYVDRAGASVTCAREPGGIPDELPPVVVAEADCTRQRTVECRTAPEDLAVDDGLDARLSDDYARYGFLHRTTGGSYFDGMVVFVREDATPAQSASASAFRSQRAPARR